MKSWLCCTSTAPRWVCWANPMSTWLDPWLRVFCSGIHPVSCLYQNHLSWRHQGQPAAGVFVSIFQFWCNTRCKSVVISNMDSSFQGWKVETVQALSLCLSPLFWWALMLGAHWEIRGGPKMHTTIFQDLGELPSSNTHTQTQNQTHWIQTNWKPTKLTQNKDIQTMSFHYIIQPSNQSTNKQPLVISLFQEAGRQTCGSEGWTEDVDPQFESWWVAKKPRASCSMLLFPWCCRLIAPYEGYRPQKCEGESWFWGPWGEQVTPPMYEPKVFSLQFFCPPKSNPT